MSGYLVNAFSANMLVGDCVAVFRRASLGDARKTASVIQHSGMTNAIGHEDLAHILGEALLIKGLHANQINVTTKPGDWLLVAQYTGPRLPEGATSLPEGAELCYWYVQIKEISEV